MLTLRRNSNSKPWWILGALLLPVLALPLAGPDYPRWVGGAILTLLVITHVLEVPAAYRLGDGKPLRIFGAAMLLMVPAIIGDTAAAMFVIFDSSARLAANGHEQGCGMGALLVIFVPVMTAMAHIAGGIILAAVAAIANAVARRLRPAAA